MRLTLAIVAALALCGAAHAAATPDDIRALGYQVTPYPKPPGGYRIVGYGVDSYFTDADLTAFANAPANCNRKWQYDHPDQLTAFNQLVQKKYAVTGDQCADRYVVSNSYTAETVYDGAGAGLVQFAAQAQTAKPAPVAPGDPPPPVVTPPVCLPLCAPVVAEPPAAPAPAAPAAPAAAPVEPAAPTPGKAITITTVDTAPAALTLAAPVAAPSVTLNPLLAAVVSNQLGAPIRITTHTLCFLGAHKTPCGLLYGQLRKSTRHVTVRATGRVASRITVA